MALPLPTADVVASIRDAEFRVQSSIAVREQYKSKLRTLVEALLPPQSYPSNKQLQQQPHLVSSPPPTSLSESSSHAKPPSDASKKKQRRDVIADRQRVRATMPEGKELHVLGDWLLLFRAASVNVVESITEWRAIVHQGRALPFEVDHANYLLEMAHDVDFLDLCGDLVNWLGFRLVRNPFITQDALDGRERDAGCTVAAKCDPKTTKSSAGSPPALLVMPLVSILPEDDVVDGARIAAAQRVVVEEEALYGRRSSLQLAERYLSRPVPVHNDDGDDAVDHKENKNVFDAIAAATKSLNKREQSVLSLQKDRARVDELTTQLERQIRVTTQHGEHDLVTDHRVWQYNDQCRKTTLRSVTSLLEQLRKRHESLDEVLDSAQHAAIKQRRLLEDLIRQRDLARQQRQEDKRRQDADEIERRKNAIRRKTLDRNRGFKTTKRPTNTKTVSRSPDPGSSTSPSPSTNSLADSATELTTDDPTTTPEAPASPIDQRVELDQKRLENLERRQRRRLEQDQQAHDEARELDRRRNENALMFLEDRRAMALEMRRRRALHKKEQQEHVKKLTAVPIFSTVQHVGGVGTGDTKFRVAVFDHRAKGYTLDGLRIAAYDPSTSSSVTLVLSTREYNALGYGRTQHGLAAFCQWLCVVYDRRKRQRKLVWSGASCPPPLRVREYDHALVCVHKEGLRVQRSSSPSSCTFYLVAAYIRTSDCSKLHFVISSVLGEETPMEIAVAASQLLPTQSMLVRSEYQGGHSYAAWLHDASDENSDLLTHNSTSTGAATRVFSGEMPGLLLLGSGYDKPSTRVHVYDVSPTEYELRIATPFKPTPPNDDQERAVVLLKHHVNPYAVRLPASAFGDLLTCLRLERDASGLGYRASVLPTWRACLARYIRAIRMAKFGCKIDGVFYLVVVTLVQQKTEFRAHLLFELAAVGADGVGARQSLRIALSQWLRCPDTIWRMLQKTESVSKQDPPISCDVCATSRHSATLREEAQAAHPVEYSNDALDTTVWHGTVCDSCDATQRSRVEIVYQLLETRSAAASNALEFLYYSTCDVCGTAPPPIIIAVPVPASGGTAVVREDGEGDDLDKCLHQFFSVFHADSDLKDDHGTTRVHDALEHNRVCVVYFPVASIATRSTAHMIVHQIRTTLFPNHHHHEEYSLPITVAVIAKRLDIFHQLESYAEDGERDDDDASFATNGPDLERAFQNLAAAIVHVGQQEPIAIDSETDDGHDGVFNFETYLVSEALLVEATRVMLDPAVEWRLPGETVGASSWSVACEFLQHPSQLALDLQHRQHDLIHMNSHTRTVLEAYVAHPKWPSELESVRAPFRSLLSSVLHVRYVQQLLDHHGGLLSASGGGPDGSISDAIYEFDKHVSILTINATTRGSPQELETAFIE